MLKRKSATAVCAELSSRNFKPIKVEDSVYVFDMRYAPAALNKALWIHQYVAKYLKKTSYRTFHLASERETFNVWVVSYRRFSAKRVGELAKEALSIRT